MIVKAAFVHGRQILDAILVVAKAVEEKRLNKEQGVLLKLDLEKAYGKVNKEFLDAILELKGFGRKWRKWMKGCLMNTNIYVIINGKPRGKIRASRGLRQGDPLSPFLFTIVGDIISRSIHYCTEKKILKGWLVGKDRIPFSLLQYTDDTLVFCPYNASDLEVVGDSQPNFRWIGSCCK